MPRGRINYDRLQQGDLAVLAMQIAKEQGGSIQTTDLKRLMVQKFKPRGNDAAVNANHQVHASGNEEAEMQRGGA